MANKNPGNNAVKHGMTSRRFVIEELGETQEAWEAFQNIWLDALQPTNSPLVQQAIRIAGLAWRLNRCEQYQLLQFELSILLDKADPMNRIFDSFNDPQPKEGLSRRKMLQHMTRLQDGKKTEVARRYEVGLERSLQRNLQLYRELQAMTTEEDNPGAC